MKKNGINTFSCLHVLFLSVLLFTLGYCTGEARAKKLDRDEFNKEIAIEKAVLKAKESEQLANDIKEMWETNYFEETGRIRNKAINIHNRIEWAISNINKVSSNTMKDSLFFIGLDVLTMLDE